jgi:hypothetical protein
VLRQFTCRLADFDRSMAEQPEAATPRARVGPRRHAVTPEPIDGGSREGSAVAARQPTAARQPSSSCRSPAPLLLPSRGTCRRAYGRCRYYSGAHAQRDGSDKRASAVESAIGLFRFESYLPSLTRKRSLSSLGPAWPVPGIDSPPGMHRVITNLHGTVIPLKTSTPENVGPGPFGLKTDQ